jgi:hypothetical protein
MNRVPIPTFLRDVELRIIHSLQGVPEQRHDACIAVANYDLAEVVEAVVIVRFQNIKRLRSLVPSMVVEVLADSILSVDQVY